MVQFHDSDDERIISSINVTPLVDIMLVLLIIFMLVSNFITEEVIEVELPHAATGDEIERETVSVTISEKGDYFLSGKKKGSLEELKSDLKERKSEKKDLQVIISADRNARHGRVVDIIDLIRKLEIYDFAINVEYNEEEIRK